MHHIKVLSLILLSMIFLASCKKTEVQPAGVEIVKPGNSSHVSSPSVVTIEARLTVAEKIDKLIVEEKINNGAPKKIEEKGYSNSTNTDTYVKNYEVPAGLASGTKITLIFTLSDKAGNTFQKTLLLQVH